jgi:hypothetical protein
MSRPTHKAPAAASSLIFPPDVDIRVGSDTPMVPAASLDAVRIGVTPAPKMSFNLASPFLSNSRAMTGGRDIVPSSHHGRVRQQRFQFAGKGGAVEYFGSIP